MSYDPLQDEMMVGIENLKGHCHDDFAVLGQFCAEIITLKLYS